MRLYSFSSKRGLKLKTTSFHFLPEREKKHEFKFRVASFLAMVRTTFGFYAQLEKV